MPVPIIENAGMSIQNHQPLPTENESVIAISKNAMPIKTFLNAWSRLNSPRFRLRPRLANGRQFSSLASGS
jgi:hypothetical protein